MVVEGCPSGSCCETYLVVTNDNPTTARERALIQSALRQAEACDIAAAKTGSSAATSPWADRQDTPPSLAKYRFIRELHRGGQGIVYLAWHEGTRRHVAIKMVREGPFVSRGEQLRFQREAEILGSLKHPNIVAIHDSDKIAGHYYFVMDFIDGPTLDEQVRVIREQLTSASGADRKRFVRRVLTLFTKICDAVQAAHLRGIIHRDLKPGNVRISSDGEPHVLDFGLAKSEAAGDDSGAPDGLTMTGQFVGTLAYASPEQVQGVSEELDVRTDVYSLGVILYEVLTGQLPYQTTGRIADIFDAIRLTEPKRPSALAQDVRGDLETIVLKCLSKDPSRRYQTAGGLAADVRRYLAAEPIGAKRDSTWYVLKMAVKRHRMAGVVGIAFVGMLSISIVTLVFQYAEQVRLRELAERRAAETTQVADFQASQLSDVDAAAMGAGLRSDLLDRVKAVARSNGLDEASVAQLIAEAEDSLAGINFTDYALSALDQNVFERALSTIDDAFEDQPLLQARLLQTVAETLTAVGLPERALAPQTEALAIRREILGDEDLDTLRSTCELSKLLQSLGRYDEALPYVEEALNTSRLVFGDEHLITLMALTVKGRQLNFEGQYEEALPYFRDALTGYRRQQGNNQPDTLSAIAGVGEIFVQMGRYDEALPYLLEALDNSRIVLGDEDSLTLSVMQGTGYLLAKMGRYDEALPLLEEALARRRHLLGSEHPKTLFVIDNLAQLLKRMGRLDDALIYQKEVLETRRRVLGEGHPDTLTSLNNMASVFHKMQRFEEALRYYRITLDKNRQLRGDKHPSTLTSLANLGNTLFALGRLEEAMPYYLEALNSFRDTRGNEHEKTLVTMMNISGLLNAMGRPEEAMPYLREALSTRRRVSGDQHPYTIRCIQEMGRLYRKMGRLEEALPYYEEAMDSYRLALDPEHPSTLNAIASIAVVLQQMDRLDEALPYAREALDGGRRVSGDDFPPVIRRINLVGEILYDMGRKDEARPYFEESLERSRRALGADHGETIRSLVNSGILLQSQGRSAEAGLLFLEAAESALKLHKNHEVRAIVTDALANYFEARHAMEPDAGYNARAREWADRFAGK